jgi:hypothetical protein
MARRYQEIWCGAGLGFGIWLLDAILNASGRGQWDWGTFVEELVVSNSPRLLFRILFLIVSLGLGYSIWLSRERARQIRDLQQAMNSLQFQITNPLLLILGYSSTLSLKEGWPASREAVEILSEIHLNSQKLNQIVRQWPEPALSRQTKDEEMREGLSTARRITV